MKLSDLAWSKLFKKPLLSFGHQKYPNLCKMLLKLKLFVHFKAGSGCNHLWRQRQSCAVGGTGSRRPGATTCWCLAARPHASSSSGAGTPERFAWYSRRKQPSRPQSVSEQKISCWMRGQDPPGFGVRMEVRRQNGQKFTTDPYVIPGPLLSRVLDSPRAFPAQQAA